jgi:hypothetical protein
LLLGVQNSDQMSATVLYSSGDNGVIGEISMSALLVV